MTLEKFNQINISGKSFLTNKKNLYSFIITKRLIERYNLKHAAAKPMINVTFETKLSKVDQPEFILEKYSIYLSFIFIYLLNKFII